MPSFFDAYPRFYATTATQRLPNRLKQRWQMIIGENPTLFEGKRVLDLACHDGRWAFAAMKSGAREVVGIEGRPELTAHAVENFHHYGIDESAFRFETGDVVEYLQRLDEQFDIVLNLGFFYHTLKHLEILEGMAKTKAVKFIIDTAITPSPEPVIEVVEEPVADPRNAIDHLCTNKLVAPVGYASRTAIASMLRYVGFEMEERPWHQRVNDFTECEDYRAGRRATFVATRT